MSVETLETKEMMKQTQADEFSASVVPQSERKSFRNILVIALGYVFVVTSMQVGGSIGVALNFKDAFGAIPVKQRNISCVGQHHGHHRHKKWFNLRTVK